MKGANMERSLLKDLIKWQKSEYRKPLLLWGARQVGKTWLMKEFGKRCFENTVYISFYNNKRMAKIFEEDYDVARILNAIEIELKADIKPEKTLLIFDEVQSAPQVVESLKYFSEEAKEYAVIAAGSLLGVSLHEGLSFPVGKVDELRLYPMSFREFLLAMGEEKLAGYSADYSCREVNDFADRFKIFLKEYLCVGGMPEVVDRYRQNRDLEEARTTQLAIVNQYEGDFGKHSTASDLPRIRLLWNHIPLQLAKENRKFFFGQVKKGARYKDFDNAIQWLADAGLVYKVSKVAKPSVPLKSYTDFSAFKLYMIDVGLLGALSELDPYSIVNGNSIFTEFKGALTEQFVLQELVAETKYTPYYYAGEKSTFEVDFVIQKDGGVVPIEVKAEDNLTSKSLKFYIDKFDPPVAIRTSTAGFRTQEKMINIPLWAIGSI